MSPSTATASTHKGVRQDSVGELAVFVQTVQEAPQTKSCCTSPTRSWSSPKAIHAMSTAVRAARVSGVHYRQHPLRGPIASRRALSSCHLDLEGTTAISTSALAIQRGPRRGANAGPEDRYTRRAAPMPTHSAPPLPGLSVEPDLVSVWRLGRLSRPHPRAGCRTPA